MIDPSGDAKHTGRVIQDTFERGITLQCAEALKKELNSAMTGVERNLMINELKSFLQIYLKCNPD